MILIALVVLAIPMSINFILVKKAVTATAALLVSLAATGALLSRADQAPRPASRLGMLYESHLINARDPVELTGVLSAPPEPAPFSYYLDLDAECIRVRDERQPAEGRVRLMISLFDKDGRAAFAALALDYGVRLRVLVRLERARTYLNPGSPDFNDFLERHGFDLKGVIKSPLLIERLESSPRVNALAVLYHSRLRLMKAIDSRFTTKIAGTLKAMLVGNRYFLDPETVEKLRDASTFHTLVIAGLHIGIIAWALLGGRSRTRRRKASRVIVCLLVLWSYAVMVGLAPPVTRATAMITVGVIGPLLFRRSASINTVALAAFFMLALKPALVADPGFQLSMAAVGGIVAVALPLVQKLQRIGQWRPSSHTPHPPSCSRPVRYLAETLFWNERAFAEEMKRAPIKYRLRKAGAAGVLGRARVQFLVKGAVLLMITSAAIQLSTLPLMAMYFNRVAPVGVLLNVVAGLLTGALMLSAIGAISIAALSGVAAGVFVRVADAAHYFLVNAIAPFIDLPFATFRVAHYEGWHSIIYVLYFAPLSMLAGCVDQWHPLDLIRPVATIARRKGNSAASIPHRSARSLDPSFRRFGLSIFTTAALTAAVITVINPPIKQINGKLIVYFLDVGQGDSALIVFPRGKTMLIDGGGEIRFDQGAQNLSAEDESQAETAFTDRAFSIGEAVVSRFIWSLGRTRVDYVLASHAHADHMGGLLDVFRDIGVREAIVGYAPTNDPEYSLFSAAAKRGKIPIFAVAAGEKYEIDGVTVEVLWPPRANGRAVTSGNDDSVVLRLAYGSISILLAADIEQNAEESLVISNANLKSDILKVPHHGSRTSSTDAFVDAVNPRVAVISVGERSRFGHPHASVVNRYLERGIKLLQTGRDGMVTVTTEGSSIDVTTYQSLGTGKPQ
jgi:competence protein ComEC